MRTPWFPHIPVTLLLASSAMWGVACGDTGVQSQAVFSLRAIPDSIHLEVGQATEFGARAFDQWGNEIPGRAQRVEWSVFNPQVAELESLHESARVTALHPGEAMVTARLGRGEGSAAVFVPPPGLEEIVIDPSPVIVSLGGAVRPVARLLDADGVEMNPSASGFRISWRTTDSTVASVPSIFNPRHMTRVAGVSLGQTRLRLIVNHQTVDTDVIVIPEPPPPAAPGVNPLSAHSLEVIWPRVSGANDGYRVLRATGAEGPFQQVAAPGAGGGTFAAFDTMYVDTGRSPSTTYWYRLKACNHRGCSEESDTASGTTLPEGSMR